jgi:eukaryotic-like serine/threonine-protein kinase
MPLSPGVRLDSCEILELLGSGGMGEVYRGRDTRLGRDVAVKALPEAFARDADRLARFQREAQALATLKHPNIAIIHELKEVGDSKYLILEMVEGETLADVIARGPVPIDEALLLSRQIAEAVEAANDQGIVHRDLKPLNIKITPEGRVKVLDFGLAKIQENQNPSRVGSQSLSLSKLNTAAGVVLGTAPYMSPEQARGKTVDRRADVWACGCLLYEMLTGRQAFPKGETVSDTLAGILAKEPDWQALPAETPPRIRALLERSLRKDPQKRLQDMGNARIELEEAHSESEAIASGAVAPKAPSRGREMQFGILAAASALIFAWLAYGFLFAPATNRPATRYEAVPPTNLASDGGYVLSPDGLKVAFVTTQPAQLWVRPLDRAMAEPIPSSEGISNSNVFWSPDSLHIGFFAEGKLKRVDAVGGPAQVVLASLPGGGNYSGTWNNSDVILLASDANPGGSVLRVPAGGGDAVPATELDKASKETSHRFPYFLPDGRHFLYLATGSDARDRAVYFADLKSKDRHRLEGIAAQAKFSSSGHLVFIRDGALMAQPFDPSHGQLTGPSFAIADAFASPAALSYPFSVSMTGALSYRTSPSGGSSAGGGIGITSIIWFDKKGNREQPAGSDGEYRGAELSPNGKYVAFARGAPADIWVLEIDTGRTERLTSEPGDDLNPRWSIDSKRIAFDSARDGASNLYQGEVGVGGNAKLVLKTDTPKTMGDWSADGKYVVYVADNDIWALPLTPGAEKPGERSGEEKPIRITNTAFVEKTPRVSPDGRWIAYVSNEPGEDRVYVQSFPTPGVRRPVSTGGGLEPRWSRNGQELLYYTGQVAPYTGGGAVIYGVSVKAAGSALDLGTPQLRAQRGVPGTTVFSMAEDGRFLLQTNPGFGSRGFSLAGRPIGSNREMTVLTMIFDWIGARAQRTAGQ